MLQPKALDQNFPHSLSHVLHVHENGMVDLAIKVYFPVDPSSGKGIQVKVGRLAWQSLIWQDGFGSLLIENLAPGTSLQFRYWDTHLKQWQPIAPLTQLERVHEVFYVPKLNYQWQHEPPQFNHGRVLMETTLEGILAGYEGGVFAPRSREELFLNPISQQILRTDILNRLAEFGIDELMIPTGSSVADLSHLDPRYNYLTYDIADINWQLGSGFDFMTLIDALFSRGLELVPDLVIAHQVRTPFNGSLDQIKYPETHQPIFVDTEAFEFRSYGTWMFNLADPVIRRQLVEKITGFVTRYRFKMLRLGYLDGLILQYAKREVNYGELLLQELKQALKLVSPDTLLLGETFSIHDNAAIKECIDLYHAPYGFPLIEELYKPPSLRSRPLYADFETLIPALNRAVQCQRQNAIYAQLHDETFPSNHWNQERAHVPWAYGANPAQLALAQGNQLVQLKVLPPEDLLDYVRRLVRSTETLTLFTTKLLYMFVPAVDSLALDSLDSPGSWKFCWDDVNPDQLNFWGQRGLSDRQIYLLHKQHRLDMARLRQLFRTYTVVTQDPNYSLKAHTEISVHHADADQGVLSLWRYNPANPYESLLICFNLGPLAFKVQAESGYTLLLPQGFEPEWEILFDGDWIDPLLRSDDRSYYLDTNEDLEAYTPGTILPTSKNSNHDPILILNLGAFSLLVLKPHR